jgi:DNA-binding transcriptional ArsR family regulator
MMTDEETDALFHALSSGARRRILDIVKASPGCSVNHVVSFFDVSRIQVMKHLRALEEGGLIISAKEGRTRRLHFNPVPIQMIHERWTTEFSAYWASQLTQLKYRVESTKEPGDG